MGKEAFCALFKDGVSSHKGSLDEENENPDVEREDTQNENAAEIPPNDGAWATSITNHPSKPAKNEAKTLNNLMLRSGSLLRIWRRWH